MYNNLIIQNTADFPVIIIGSILFSFSYCWRSLFFIITVTIRYACCLVVNSVYNSFATPWTAACQSPLSMGFPRQEYWNRLPFPFWGELPEPRNWIHLSCTDRSILYLCAPAKPITYFKESQMAALVCIPSNSAN